MNIGDVNSNNGNKYNNNNKYGMNKHIKQKLLDRINNASNNGWQYVYKVNRNNNNNKGNKKFLMEI